MERIGASHRQHSTERPPNMKRAARLPTGTRTSRGGRPRKPAKKLPTIRRKDLPVVRLPRQTRSQGGKTKLTNHRAAIILHAISCGCYRETAAELASIKAETLSHWMGWSGEPYETFQRLVRKAEASLESRMVNILTGQAEVRPELALAILERKFPQRWAKVTVVAAPPHHLTFNERRRHPPESSRTDRSRPRSKSASPGHHHQRRREPNQTTRSTSAQARRRIRPARG